MADVNLRSDAVDVEAIMQQIRSRIREKRGVDYTEEQVRELATVRLEQFLDPKNLRSDLLDQFRRTRPSTAIEPQPIEAPYAFDDQTLFASHRGPLRFMRQLLRPILKLFFNPNTLNNILHTQAQFNLDLLKREERRRIEFDRARGEWNTLYYEVLHNLVLETTRTGIEVKNLRMRVESLASRLDFSERRVRALEGVVQYRPEALGPARTPRPDAADLLDGTDAGEGDENGDLTNGAAGDSPAARRRRRRRRGRRPTGPGVPGNGGGEETSPSEGSGAAENAAPDTGPIPTPEDRDREHP